MVHKCRIEGELSLPMASNKCIWSPLAEVFDTEEQRE